jgi:PPK2 family polyphosphate:nucleotide phosphotransferase
MDVSRFTRPPGKPFRLAEVDPREKGGFEDKDEAKEHLERHLERLNHLQQRLYAGGEHALLIVLQGMDTGGKDGTIRHVMGAFDPQGVRVTSFKAPTEEELDHDFLWRVHRATPRRGMVGIFNRSHYEDVLVVRVKSLVPEEVWRPRYEQIVHFEELLAAGGVTVVKLFLHISPGEQAERLRERQRDPEKQWKFRPGDLEDRKLWGQYMAVYEEALTRCNTRGAPWYVVPADHKWYRNLVVSEILIATLEALDLQLPEPAEDVTSYEIPEAG